MDGGKKKIEQDQFLIQLCVKEDFPVSLQLSWIERTHRWDGALLKKKKIYISGLISRLNLLLAGDLLEVYFLTL